jgi:chromosome segregation ATPase
MMDNSQASSSNTSGSASSQHYSALLSTVAELRSDLERAVSRMHALETENGSLKSSYSRIKDELVDTRKKYLEARDNYMTTVSEKIEVENQYEGFMEKVKVQLAEKTKEFEQLRDKLAPQDIDYVRIKVQEELEIPHRQKIMALETEIEQLRDQYFMMRRESEKSKTEYETYTQNQRNEVVAIRNEHDAIVAGLREQITTLQDREYAPEKDDLLRGQKFKIDELQHLVNVLKEEVRVVRNESDSLRNQLEVTKSKEEETGTANRARMSVLESQKTELEQRLSIMTLDADKKEAQLRSLKTSAEDLSSELQRCRKAQGDTEARLASVSEEHSRVHSEMEAQYDKERKEVELEVDLLHAKLNEREDILRRAQREATEQQQKAELVDMEMRRSYVLQLQEITRKYNASELELADERNEMKMLEVQRQKLYEKIEIENEVHRSEIDQLKREKGKLHDRLREMDNKMDEEKRRYGVLKREANVKLSLLQDAVRDSRTKQMEAEKTLTTAQKAEANVQTTLKVLQEKLNHAAVEHSNELSSTRKELQERILRLGGEYTDKLEEVKRNAKTLISKEKKKSEVQNSSFNCIN